MSFKNRIVSLALSAAMLLAPAASLAENSFASGELTKTVVSDSYVGGNQIDVRIGLAMENSEALADSARMQAVASLLSKSELQMSFYDDFGTACFHAELITDEVTMLSVDALVYEDGSAQIMTNLTGNYVLTLPKGTFAGGGLNLMSLIGDAEEYDGSIPFAELSADERLKVTLSDLNALLINHLLGWVSGTQMNYGDLYVFDDTYIEETDTRDAVAQRMLGTIHADAFTSLIWNICATICDEQGDFQQAVADVLAEKGITRYQVHQFTDMLFTQETIDPATDYVQTSYSIADDGTLCTYNDVSYFFKKLVKSTDYVWANSTDNVLHMDVSYDDYGGMVGFDADMPQFSTVVPYEGFFNYSIKTDENWQRLHTAHGELQVYDENRVIGDLDIQFGEDVDGVNASSFVGQADVVNQKDGTSSGIGVNAFVTYTLGSADAGEETEAFSGGVALALRRDGEPEDLLTVGVTGETVYADDSFAIDADVSLAVTGAVTLLMDVTVEQVEYEEIPFAGGQAFDLTSLSDDDLTTLQGEVMGQATKLSLNLVMHPAVLTDLMAIISQ